jgi:hypothetical protein
MTIESENSSAANPIDLPPINAAIARCMDAWTREHQAVLENNRGRCAAKDAAAAAYQRTLPALLGMDNIRDFIACVAHGMAIGAIEGASASRLLYAAQVAKGASSSSHAQKKLPT